MTIDCDRLYLQPHSNFPLYPNIAIDIFLQSLAEAKGDEGIAVILSGMGSDGSKGATMLKEKGGMVIVQAVQSAEHRSMPESAIRTGSVDYELLPEEMPGTILKHINKWIKTRRTNSIQTKHIAALAHNPNASQPNHVRPSAQAHNASLLHSVALQSFVHRRQLSARLLFPPHRT